MSKEDVAGTRAKRQSSPGVHPTVLPAAAASLLSLQQTRGNHFAQRLLRSGVIRAKLTINQPGDPSEQEADRVADAVMRTPEAGEEAVVSGQTRRARIQRLCAGCEEEKLQAKEVPSHTSEGASNLEAGLDTDRGAVRGGSRPLPESVRAFFEPRFGYDFSQVRIHIDDRAADSARSVRALAYTVGQDIVFGAGRYQPGTDAGKRLLAHELTHTIQQARAPMRYPDSRLPTPVYRASRLSIARQCDPAWAALAWSQRVANAQGMAGGAARNQCMADMISEALGGSVTIHQSTNNSASVNAAITANHYTELGSFANPNINFDRNLNAKIGNPNLFGNTTFRVPAGGNDIRIFIILGPQALNPIGPQFTEMAYGHEQSHATDFLLQWATGAGPHAATAGEEVAIYTQDFIRYFLDLWAINNAPPCAFQLATDFSPLFQSFAGAAANERDQAFAEIESFFHVRIENIPCNLMKFKIWLQGVQNARPAADLLVNRINGLPGLNLVRGTAPVTHLQCPTPCP